jgi:hypothetical protein
MLMRTLALGEAGEPPSRECVATAATTMIALAP